MVFGSRRDSERFYSRLYSCNYHANRGSAAVCIWLPCPPCRYAIGVHGMHAAGAPEFPLVRPPVIPPPLIDLAAWREPCIVAGESRSVHQSRMLCRLAGNCS